jgi:hypothetical protein
MKTLSGLERERHPLRSFAITLVMGVEEEDGSTKPGFSVFAKNVGMSQSLHET